MSYAALFALLLALTIVRMTSKATMATTCPSGGALDIFIVPIAADSEQVRYEAVFN